MCRPMLLYKANIEIRECVKWSLQEVKNKRKSLNFQAQKRFWSRSLTGGGRLPEVPTLVPAVRL